MLNRSKFTVPNSVYRIAQQWLHIPVVVPFYHAVLGDRWLPHHGRFYRRSSDFITDLDFFVSHFNIINLPKLLSYLDGNCTLPPQALLLSFDDGMREVSEVVVPLLKKKGIPAVFFLNNSVFIDDKLLFPHLQNMILHHASAAKDKPDASYHAARDLLSCSGLWKGSLYGSLLDLNSRHGTLLEKIAEIFKIDQVGYCIAHKPYLRENDVSELIRQGFHIGSHGWDHVHLTGFDSSTQVDHTVNSVFDLCKRFGIPYRAFSFPYNDVGVSKSVYTALFQSGDVHVTFGASLMRSDFHPRSIQRLNFEKGHVSGRRILVEGFSKRALLQALGQGTMNRS